MPGPLLTITSQVLCSHTGQAKPTIPNPRVLVNGQPTVVVSTPYVVAACPFVPPANGPCVTGQWFTGTVRVFSNAQPLLVQSSTSTCAPTGTPMVVIVAQPTPRVMAV